MGRGGKGCLLLNSHYRGLKLSVIKSLYYTPIPVIYLSELHFGVRNIYLITRLSHPYLQRHVTRRVSWRRVGGFGKREEVGRRGRVAGMKERWKERRVRSIFLLLLRGRRHEKTIKRSVSADRPRGREELPGLGE